MTYYKVSWTELVGYYTYIEANSPKEALEKFDKTGCEWSNPDGSAEMEPDSSIVDPTPVDPNKEDWEQNKCK